MKSCYRTYFTRNIAFIRQNLPGLYESTLRDIKEPRFEKARDGSLTFKKHGIYIESRHSPAKRSIHYLDRDYTENSLLIFLGSGLGYHINALLQKGSYRCVLIEKDPEIFVASLHVLDPQFFPLFRFFINEEPEEVIKKLSPSLEKTHYFIKHAQSIDLHIDYYRQIEESVRKRSREQVASSVTERKMRRLWIKNILKNTVHPGLKYYSSNSWSEKLSGSAILIASGPYLEDIINDLKEISKRLPVFCLLPSLPYLLNHGIKPDITLTTEARFGNQYRIVRGSEIPLVTTLSVLPAVLKEWSGPRFLFSHGLSLERNLGFIQRKGLYIPMQGTSATVMIQLARIMGFKRIYLAGFDFAYRGLKDHHSGAGFDAYHLSRTSRLSNWHTAVFKGFKKEPLIKGESSSGKQIFTSFKLSLYKEWLEREVLGEDLVRLNEGVLIKNLKTVSPSKLIDRKSENKSLLMEYMHESKPIFRREREDAFLQLLSFLDEIRSQGQDSINTLYSLFYGSLPEESTWDSLVQDVSYAFDLLQRSARFLRCGSPLH